MNWALERERQRWSAWAALTEFRLIQAVEKIREAVQARKATQAELRATAAEKLRHGAPLTREELAAYLDVDEKKLYRLEKRGKLRRCSALGRDVRYPSGEVLRLASDLRKEI